MARTLDSLKRGSPSPTNMEAGRTSPSSHFCSAEDITVLNVSPDDKNVERRADNTQPQATGFESRQEKV